MGGSLRLPGVAGFGECERLAVQAGCFQCGRGAGVELGWLAGFALSVQAPREQAALFVYGGDPVTCSNGLHVSLAPVVRPDGFAAGFPGPDAAVRAGDDGLVLVAGDPAGFLAVRQADGNRIGRAVGQVPGLSVRVQEEESSTEGLGLDDANFEFCFDAYWLGFPSVARLPGPGLSIRVHDEILAAGGGGEDGMRLPGQICCGLFNGLYDWALRVGLAGLEGVDPALLVHGQEPVIVRADAGELGVLINVEDRGRCLSAGPGVDPLVGSQGGLPPAVGCGLQVMEPFGSLGGEVHLCWRALLRPCVDAAVAGQADGLLACGVDGDVIRLLAVGRADGQTGAGCGPVVRAQRPVRGFRPPGFQSRVLEDRGLEVVGLAVKHPPVEPEAMTLRIVFRRGGECPGLHACLGWFAPVGRVETHRVCILIIRFS